MHHSIVCQANVGRRDHLEGELVIRGENYLQGAPLPGNRYINRWVKARSNDYGFGFCRKVDRNGAAIAYFDIPGKPWKELVVPTQEIVLPRISHGTRTWLPGQPYGWIAGEIAGWAGFDEYFVRVAGLPRNLKVPGSKLTIRWDRPLRNPVEAVTLGLCDSPEYFEARDAFLHQLIRQRRVARGFTAALSAPIEFYQHQIDTAARVLSDPVLRYLLADEVGLGKTIEAGLIVRQLLLDDHTATALVTVPPTLVRQWRTELQDRLLLRDAFTQDRIQLLSHDDVVNEGELTRHAIIVVDEAHQILPILERHPVLRTQLLKAQGLLLLSATPMRGNPSAFLEMLNLVDPQAFTLDHPDEFRARLESREQQATDLPVLTSRRATFRQRNSVLTDLLNAYASDPVVVQLAAECRAIEDLSAPNWVSLVNYVRETYRISRRMIRNRRGSDLTDDYPVTGRNTNFVPIADPARPLVDEFLEQYRDLLAGRAYHRTFAQAILHGLAGPRALLHHLERRLADNRPRSIPTRDRPLIEGTAARLRMATTTTRQQAALKVIADRLATDRKVVVISTSQDVAREFFDLASERWPGRVGGHLAGRKLVQHEEDVAAFLGDKCGRVLVGDHTVEEGRNLQDAHVLVNLDLPLDPNRLEQRIGRLDRFARRTDPAELVVFTEPNNEWVTAHVKLLHDGIGIFDKSVATLQRKLSEVVEKLAEDLLPHGIDAFKVDIPTLQDSLTEEQIEIDLLEELESVAGTSDIDDVSLADLRAVDSDTDGLRKAFRRFASVRGGIGLRPDEDAISHLLRFGARNDPRIHGLSDDDVEELRPLLTRPKAYARDVAASHQGVAPLRIGDPLVDWLERFIRNDERGRARAIIRPSAKVRFPYLWLACDFIIEFDTSGLGRESAAVRRRIRRRGDALLPPTVVRTWTDTNGPAAPEMIERELAAPFDARSDQVVRGQLWAHVLSELPDWRELCRLSGDAARAHLNTSSAVSNASAAAVERASKEVQARRDVLRARSLRLPSAAERSSAQREMESEDLLGQALINGVGKPLTSIIACGAVILWPAS